MQDLSKLSDEELRALLAQSQSAPSQGQVIHDPTYQAQTVVGQMQPRREAAEIERIQTQTERERAQLEQDRLEAQEAQTDAQDVDAARRLGEIRSQLSTDNVVSAIRRARQIAQTEGGVGWSGLLADLPETSAKKIKVTLEPVLGNLAFDRLQQMRDESKTGGALGQVSERELALLQSTVASLDLTADLDTFLNSLDTIERSFLSAQMAEAGIDPRTDLGRGIMVDEFGYSGFFDGQPAEQFSLTQGNTASEEIPPAYQQEHLRYLRENWRNIKPEDYVAFRSRLDERFNLTPDLNAYENAAYDFNSFAAEGGEPEQLGVVPSPDREVGAVEGLLNQGAQTGLGTYFSQAGNAVTAGLLGQATGNQQEIELQRAARPGASFAGELTGGALGATALGAGGAAMAGGGRLASMIAGPYGADALHSTIYGGTQGGLEGAAYGLGGALAGGRLGQMIGRNIAPETFAPNAYRAAQDVVPTVDELKSAAGREYDRVQAQGVTAQPDAVADLNQRARTVLASEGRIGGDGRVIIQDSPTKQAYELMTSFENANMTPRQALTVRETLGEGLTAKEPKDRRIAGMLLDEFDNWADSVLPEANKARDISRRYIQGQQIQAREGLGVARGNRMKGNDVGDSIRTQFGQLDEAVMKGNARFDLPTREAIAKVAQGDPVTNSLRSAGKYGFGSVMPATGLGATGAGLSYLTGNPLPALAAAGTGAVGYGARRLAERNTLRAAQEAENTALGGQAYLDALELARQQAGARAGNFFGGLFGAATSTLPRQ